MHRYLQCIFSTEERIREMTYRGWCVDPRASSSASGLMGSSGSQRCPTTTSQKGGHEEAEEGREGQQSLTEHDQQIDLSVYFQQLFVTITCQAYTIALEFCQLFIVSRRLAEWWIDGFHVKASARPLTLAPRVMTAKATSTSIMRRSPPRRRK